MGNYLNHLMDKRDLSCFCTTSYSTMSKCLHWFILLQCPSRPPALQPTNRKDSDHTNRMLLVEVSLCVSRKHRDLNTSLACTSESGARWPLSSPYS